MDGRTGLLAVDLDDTLFPESEYVRSGFRAVGEYLRRELGLSGFVAAAQSLFDAGHRRTIFDAALRSLEVEADLTHLVPVLVDVYRSHRPSISLYPDATRFLEWARSEFVVAVITDGYATAQRRKIEALDLRQRVDEIVVCDELGSDCWKPSRVPFDVLVERVGVAGHDAVYIGDNPGKDVAGPRGAGWRSILLRRPEGEHAAVTVADADADAVVTDLDAARTVLSSWRSGITGPSR